MALMFASFNMQVVKDEVIFTQQPSHVWFSAAVAGTGSLFCQTLPVPTRSQCTPSTTLRAFLCVADQWPVQEWLAHAQCHQELPPFLQTNKTIIAVRVEVSRILTPHPT